MVDEGYQSYQEGTGKQFWQNMVSQGVLGAAQIAAMMFAGRHGKNLLANKLGLTGEARKAFSNNFDVMDGHTPAPNIPATDPIYFAQRAVGSTFSDRSEFKGMELKEVAELLKSGKVSPDSLPVYYTVLNGQKITINNRSLTTLSLAGMKPTVTIDVTGNLKAYDRLDPDTIFGILQRMNEMDFKPMTSMPVRLGKGWDAPIQYTVPLHW